MSKFIFLWLLLLGLVLIGECHELPGGENIAVNGQATSGTGSSPPVYNYPKTTVITRDPANYMVPATTIPKRPTTETPAGSNNISSLGTAAPTMVFTLTSDVEGTGFFALRSKLEKQDEDYRAYQSISAIYGNLTHSRKMRFTEDEQISTDINYTLVNIDTQDSIEFVGKSYRDISRFQNKDDLIQEKMRAGAISKTSRFVSQHLQVSFDNNETKTLRNDYTVYNIDTRFVGSSDLRATTNGTEIMQTYIGQIVLNRKIGSQFVANDTFLDDQWLPCCNSSFISDRF